MFKLVSLFSAVLLGTFSTGSRSPSQLQSRSQSQSQSEFHPLAQIATLASPQLIIWNVGQGQWITEVHDKTCLHYDAGGEFDVSASVLKLCRNKQNILHLSHWDLDHISFATKYARLAASTCLFQMPLGKSSKWKTEMISQIRLCSPTENHNLFTTVYPGRDRSNSNSASRVVYSRHFRTLISGDSPTSLEKNWRWQVPSQSTGFILGHHGSRTSNSQALLRHMPNLRWVVASARSGRYGHPHALVKNRLEQMRLPLLKTEDWGHLHFQKALPFPKPAP